MPSHEAPKGTGTLCLCAGSYNQRFTHLGGFFSPFVPCIQGYMGKSQQTYNWQFSDCRNNTAMRTNDDLDPSDGSNPVLHGETKRSC